MIGGIGTTQALAAAGLGMSVAPANDAMAPPAPSGETAPLELDPNVPQCSPCFPAMVRTAHSVQASETADLRADVTRQVAARYAASRPA